MTFNDLNQFKVMSLEVAEQSEEENLVWLLIEPNKSSKCYMVIDPDGLFKMKKSKFKKLIKLVNSPLCTIVEHDNKDAMEKFKINISKILNTKGRTSK